MSSVMAYLLFWMMVIHKLECAVIRYQQNRNTLEYVIQKYMKPLRRLSADLPNHAIEMEIEIHGSVPTIIPKKVEVTTNPRRFIRLINPRPPKAMARAQEEAAGSEAASAPDVAVSAPGTSDVAQPAPAASADLDNQKIPVFMEDLKKALDDLEKKLLTTPENAAAVPPNGNAPSIGATAAPPGPNSPAAAPPSLRPQSRSIDDIVQMLKKAIHIEHRMPQAGDENLEWVQIKIPKSMQL